MGRLFGLSGLGHCAPLFADLGQGSARDGGAFYETDLADRTAGHVLRGGLAPAAGGLPEAY